MKFFLVLLVLIYPPILFSNTIDLEELSKDRTWLHLLHFDNYASKSSIVSKEFFVSPNGMTDSYSELLATIEAYNNHPLKTICKYPARTTWLNEKLKLKNFKKNFDNCKSLHKRLKLLDIDSISLVFVSGYMKNPASTFGHTFLKLNKKSDVNKLLDTTLSFGAIVPDNENIMVYIFKGIFGFYDATYSDKYFFTHDMAYTKTELRDMWEYKLNLPKEKVTFLLLHIFEISNKQFQYYFFKKNCAYEITKLVELILEEDIVSSKTAWYAPVEPFISLSKTDYIRDILYHPSRETKIYKYYKILSNNQKQLVSRLISSQLNFKSDYFLKSNKKDKTIALDFLLRYYKYKLVITQNKDKVKKLKNKVLLKRFDYPPTKEEFIFKQTNTIPPDKNSPPMNISLLGAYSSQKSYYPIVGLNLFSMSSIGRNSLNGDELVVLDSYFAYKNNDAFINNIDLIRVKKFSKNILPFESFKYSWEVQIGMRNNFDDSLNSYDYFAEGGMGGSWFFKNFFTFAMADLALHSNKNYIRFMPKIGFRSNFYGVKSFAFVGYEIPFEKNQNELKAKFETQYNYSQNKAIYLNYEYYKNSTISIGLKYYY
jgi:hypothetical protein